MKRIVIAAITGFWVSAADGDSYRLLFDISGNAGADNAPHPGSGTLSFNNPILPTGGGRLFLYAEFHGADQTIPSPNFEITIDGGTITEAWNYNGPGQDSLTGDRRWDLAAPNPVMNPGGNSVEFTAENLTHLGLKNGAYAGNFDVQHDSTPSFGNTLLGYVDVVNVGGPASVWMTLLPTNVWADRVFLGFRDNPIPGSEFNRRSDVAEATIVPEPVTGALLLTALLLFGRQRRR